MVHNALKAKTKKVKTMKHKIAKTRLSFPSLFRTATFGEQDTGKYEATFILDKVAHAKEIEQIKGEIAKLMKDELKGKIASDKLCLKDGDESGRPEFEGTYTLKASTKKRPVVIGRDRAPLTEDDNIVYAGCYVNAIFSLWAQNNQYGKRINAQLDGVQFNCDGDPFGEGSISVDEFADFGDDDFEDDINF
jgi:hypothetical protein